MADGPKIIEFRSSDSGDGRNGSGGTSLVPVGSNGLTSQQQEQVKHFGELLDRQADEYARYYGQFFDEFINFFSDAANKARQAEEDIIDGEFSVGDGGSGGNDPPGGDDPFSFMDDGRHMPDDVRKWLDELEQEYKTQAELLERSNQAYDELTEQADGLLETQEEFAINLEHLDSVVEITVSTFLALITASLAYIKVTNELVEAVGGFSAEVVRASIRSRLQEIEDRLELAAQAGGIIADMEMARSDLASEYRHLMRELIELVGPTLTTIAKAMTATVGKVTMFTEAWNDFNKFNQQLALFMAAIRAASEGNIIELIRIRKALEESNKENTTNLNQSIDNLFDPENIWDDDDDGAMDMPGGDPRGRNQLPNGRGRP